MMKIKIFIVAGVLLISSAVFAQDVSIDGSGNLSTGTSNSYGNLKVTGASGEHGVAGETSGTGAAGVYGKNTDSSNYGALGSDNYGVYGNSSTGYAGYFQGNARITGNLTVDGTFNANHNHDTLYVNEDQASSVTSSMIVDGTIQQGDLSFSLGDGYSLDAADGSPADAVYVNNNGNVGIGTINPGGKLDVNGDICLGGVCRTTWPSGSGAGAFTDTGTSAYYNGGNVGIGTSSPVPLGNTDTRVLHLMQPVALLDNAAAGVRLEVGGIVNGGLTSAYNHLSGDGGVFVGALSNHRLGFITNSMEKMTLSSSGYLGIDTTSPLQPLHVEGNAYISDNLGVGIDSPAHKLHISGSDALFASGTGDFRLYVSSADNSAIVFQKNFTGYAEMGLSNDNNLRLKVSADGVTFTDLMIIEHTDANIGIGIYPDAKLHIKSTNDFPALTAENSGANFAIAAMKKGTGDAVYIKKQGLSGNGLVIEQITTGSALKIKNISSDIFVVESSGNVGIGTSTPQGTLDVNGAIYQRGGVLHADYVFEPDYKLESIQEHSDFMWNNKHLKAIPKATVDTGGKEIVEVGSHRRGIVEELEKAHIYIDQMHRQIQEQYKMIQLLEERLTRMEAHN